MTKKIKILIQPPAEVVWWLSSAGLMRFRKMRYQRFLALQYTEHRIKCTNEILRILYSSSTTAKKGKNPGKPGSYDSQKRKGATGNFG